MGPTGGGDGRTNFSQPAVFALERISNVASGSGQENRTARDKNELRWAPLEESDMTSWCGETVRLAVRNARACRGRR